MSNQREDDDDHGPLSKGQNHGDEAEAAQVVALGGPMYDEVTARRMLKEAVHDVMDEPTYYDGETDEPVFGFDPDDAALDDTYDVYDLDDGFFSWEGVTPMLYFAHKGDVKMCRYLISRGASTTKRSAGLGSRSLVSPMSVAAEYGHLEFCKVLHANGAQTDIWTEDDDGWTPFQHAAFKGHDKVVRWLVLQGALCADDNSEEIQRDPIYPRNYRGTVDEDWAIRIRQGTSPTCDRLIEWADEVTSSHSSVVMFLLGTLPPPPDTDQSCILQCLSGHNGVRKHIADFVGMEVTKAKHLRILRNVKDVLPSFIRTEEEEE